MKRLFTLGAMVLWLPIALSALDTLNVRLHKYAQGHPPQFTESIEDLAADLQTVTSSDFERAEIAAYWIAAHFEYDISAYYTEGGRTVGDLDLETMLRLQKGTARTFSQLYRQLCQAMGLPAFVVPGYHRRVIVERSEYGDYDGRRIEMPTHPFHSWVAVKIGEKYYFTDISLGMGQLIGDYGSFEYEKKLDLEMLLTREELFVARHIPADPMWQLSEKPVQLRTFYRHLVYEDMLQKEPYANNFDFQALLSEYEKATPSVQRLLELERTADYFPIPFNIRQAADAQNNMGYTLSLEEFSEKKMIAARRYYHKAIATYGLLEQDSEIEALLSQVQQGITYVEYRLENKQ